MNGIQRVIFVLVLFMPLIANAQQGRMGDPAILDIRAGQNCRRRLTCRRKNSPLNFIGIEFRIKII